MDLSWVMIIVGGALVFSYIFFNASEKRIKALENKIRHIEKQLKQTTQGLEMAEPDVNEELRTLLQQGKTIQAVKRTRQEFGWSLLEAKQYVDDLKAGK